jgi:hypothetical protein
MRLFGRTKGERNISRRVKLLVGSAAALAVGLGGGTAYAYFTSSGGGSGAATTGTAQPVTVLQITGSVSVSPKLYPGATNGTLQINLNNPNSYSVNIVSITGNGTVTGSGGVGTCTTTGVTVNTQSGLSIPVASGNPVSVSVPNSVSMDATSSHSDTGCQGATFQVPVIITVQKG